VEKATLFFNNFRLFLSKFGSAHEEFMWFNNKAVRV